VQTPLAWNTGECYTLGWENLLRLENLDRSNKIIFGWITKRDRQQLYIFERKVCRRILGPVCENEKENRRIFTYKEIYAIFFLKTYRNRDNKATWITLV
jgi:hypothetical protein